MCVSIVTPPSNFEQINAGTIETPFLISSLSNLKWLSETQDVWGCDEIKYHFILTNNIDATETKYWNNGHGFKPIGIGRINTTYNEWTQIPFMGYFNGNNYTISNIFINQPKEENIYKVSAFFGTIRESHIVNLNLEDIVVFPDYINAGLVAMVYNSSIRNTSVSGTVHGNDSTLFIGGFAGLVRDSSLFSIYSKVSIIGDDNFNMGGSGGIAAALVDSTLHNSFFHGNKTRNAVSMGGLIASSRNSTIKFSYVASGSKLPEMAAIVSMIDENSVIDNCFWDRQVTGLNNAFTILPKLFDITPRASGLNTSQMKILSTFSEDGWDFSDIWDIDPNINKGYPFLRR